MGMLAYSVIILAPCLPVPASSKNSPYCSVKVCASGPRRQR
jgi:hypothetical protein